MKGSFRQSMAWLHTWSGLIVGWLLFAIFLTGTVSFYRQEITLWMQPELHDAKPAAAAPTIALGRAQELAPTARRWLIDLPDNRDPIAHIYIWRDAGQGPGFQREALDTATMRPSAGRPTYGGDFLYYFHFDLNVPSIWGRLIVGAAAIIMLVAIVSGVITHRRIFKDFFTFRPRQAAQRSWLDAHNVLGVMALPFHIMITYTGLITLMFLYMPWGIDVAYDGNRDAFFQESMISTAIPDASNTPADLVEIEPLIAEAKRRWGGSSVGRIDVYRPGDANALIALTSSDAENIAHHGRKIVFSGVTGKVVSATNDAHWAARTRAVMYGLHLGRFADPSLRFLYFLSGIAGTAMIATGLVLWVIKRRAKPNQTRKAGFGFHMVDALNIGTIAGLPIAIAALFWSNRLLPVDLPGRADWEVKCFYLVWILAFLHAALRPARSAWIEQFLAGGLVFATLPALGFLTTRSHLGVTLPAGNWTLAGLDLIMVLTGLLFIWMALYLANRHARPSSETLRVRASSAATMTEELEK